MNPTPALSNRIDQKFAECQKERRAALILYVTAGFPDLETTARLLPALQAAGADIIELGIPFSDPIADGPTIQRASARALEAGATLQKILALLKQARANGLTLPVVLFGAFNPFLHHGLPRLALDAADAGADGFLAADLPIEESDEFQQPLRDAGLHLIFLAAPTTPQDRLASIAQKASGFLYAIALKGVTGARTELPPDLEDYLARIRKASPAGLPLALGFGVSTPAQVARIATHAQGVVVGSALIAEIERATAQGEDPVVAAQTLTRSLAAALKKN